jgi:hypothetical protein
MRTTRTLQTCWIDPLLIRFPYGMWSANMTPAQEQLARVYDDWIFELRRRITKWQLYMREARAVDAAHLVDRIAAASNDITELEARKAVLGEPL